jgi:hypothetical protein
MSGTLNLLARFGSSKIGWEIDEIGDVLFTIALLDLGPS